MKAQSSGGYTLIEILAVLMLIGMLMMIVYPQFTNSPERNEVIYIGKLIKADLALVKEEAFSGKEELAIEFINQGYNFQIGDARITRNFNDYQFSFIVPELKETGDSGKKDQNATPEPSITATPSPAPGTENLSIGASGGSNAGTTPAELSEDNEEDSNTDSKEAQDEESKPNELIFSSDGKCNALELTWQTMHFSGTLKVDQDGVVTWTYAQK
jgi:prepilin-type N-terminal cleavage/methylation domain-containing protein